jgi:phosphoribosylamine-glycine ligase
LTYTAQGTQDARQFLQKYPARWVLKPHDNKVQVYISEGIEDALEVLDWWESLGLTTMEIDVQQFIEGRNVDVELWFGNGAPFLPANYDIETKKFLVDDLGMTVGCMSSVCWFSYRTDVRVLQEVLFPFAQQVKRTRWTGPASINIMIEEGTNELYALELTPRIGYNAYYCLHHLKESVGWGEIIWRMCHKETEELEVIEGLDETKFAVGIEVSIPPSPVEHPDKQFMKRLYEEIAKGVPLWVHEERYPAHVHLCDVMKDEHGRLVCAGTNGIVAEVIAVDEDPHAALRKCAETVKMLKIPNKQARIRDALDDFDRYYAQWTKQNIVAPLYSIARGIVSPSPLLL